MEDRHPPRPVPASFFGIVLGLSGLGSDWRAASALWGLPGYVGESLLAVASAVWLVLLVAYVQKWLTARSTALAELEHPTLCCFVGLVGVSTMLVGAAALPYSRLVALVLFGAGAFYTAAFAVWRTGSLDMGGRDPSANTAILYLPAVAGSFVTATVAGALGHADWGQYAFGAGLFSWLAIESVLLHRLFTAPAMALALRPAMGIQLAPPAVAAVAYLSVTSGPPGLFAHALIGYGIFQGLILLRLLPWIREQPFGVSYWAFSFGLTSLAGAPLRMLQRGDSGPISLLAPMLFAVANVTVAVLAVGTIRQWVRGQLLPAPAPAPR